MEPKINPNTYALITGGGTGIGRALAEELATLGYNIALVSLPDTGLNETQALLENNYNVQVKCLEIDLTTLDSIELITQWISSNSISVQVLVNNAGIGFASSFNDLSLSFIRTLIDVNIKSTTLLTHALLPELKKHNQAFILNMSSAAAFYSMPYKSIYAASKRYILDFSMALREELKEDQISVTAVCPAGVITSSEIRERINKAGFMAKKSALEPEQVAKEAVQAMLKNKAYKVPGRMARLISKARFIFPASISRKAISKSFKKRT